MRYKYYDPNASLMERTSTIKYNVLVDLNEQIKFNKKVRNVSYIFLFLLTVNTIMMYFTFLIFPYIFHILYSTLILAYYFHINEEKERIIIEEDSINAAINSYKFVCSMLQLNELYFINKELYNELLETKKLIQELFNLINYDYSNINIVSINNYKNIEKYGRMC